MSRADASGGWALVRDLFPGPPPSPIRVAAYVVAIVVLTGLVQPDWYRAKTQTGMDDQAILSMELAMSWAFCGRPSTVSPTIRVPYEVRDHPELGTIPVRQLAAERAGSVERYCQTVTDPLLSGENSLMWLESWLWSLQPNDSVMDLGRLLHRIRVAALVVVLAVMLALGWGLVAAVAAWLWMLILLQDLQPVVHSVYPFLPVLLTLTAALYAMVARGQLTRTSTGAAVVAGLAGVWTAFASNLRTSHLPVYVVLAVLMFAFGERPPSNAKGRWPRLGLAAAVFVLSHVAFQYQAISRHLPDVTTNMSYHPIAHPLVLALGVPPSDLSRREGILWSDAAGLAIATRVQPGVTYYGPGYEAALFRYYRGLWRDYPSEMIGIYFTKARMAGKQMLDVLRTRHGPDRRVIRIVLLPLDLLPNGIYLFLLYVTVAAVALRQAWRHGGPALLLTNLAVPALLLHLESVIIASDYSANYHSYLAFFAVFLVVGGVVAAIGRTMDAYLAN